MEYPIGGGKCPSKTSGPRLASFLSASEQYHFTATTVRVGAFVTGVHNPEHSLCTYTPAFGEGVSLLKKSLCARFHP